MNIKPGFLVIFLVFLSLGVYYSSLFAPYNLLDDQLLVQQLLNQDSFSFARHFAPGGTYDYYRPLVTLAFEIDKYVGGLQESFMHLVNILLHTLNVILIFLLARRFAIIVGSEGNLLPFLSSALFCLHPLNTEAVNWITGRTDLLAGTFVFSSLLFMLKALERRSLLWGGAGAISLLGGALCKETALFLLPGIFFLLVWRPSAARVVWTGRWLILALCTGSVLGYFALRWGAFATDRGIGHTAKFIAQVVTAAPIIHTTPSGTHPVHLMDMARTILKVSGFYVIKLFQPLPLNFAINRVDGSYLVPGVALAFVLPILVFRRRPVGVFFLLSALLGSSALLVVFTRLAWTPVAERYMYIPSGLFSVAVVFGSAMVVERLRWQKICPVVVPLILGTCAWATVERNIVWQDNLTLYEDTVRKSPDFGPARNQLALALYTYNRTAEATTLLASLPISEGQSASLNQAALMIGQRRYGDARAILFQSLANPGANEERILEMLVKATSEMAEQSKGRVKKRMLYGEVAGWLERLECLTHNAFHWYRLGRVYLILNNRHEAQRCFSEAARRLPSDSIFKEPAAKLARKLAT